MKRTPNNKEIAKNKNKKKENSSLDRIISLSLNTLKKNDLELEKDVVEKVIELSQIEPRWIQYCLMSGVLLSRESSIGKGFFSHAYIENALEIIRHRPEMSQRFRDSTLDVLKEAPVSNLISLFRDSKEVFLKAPDKIEEYYRIGKNFLQYDKEYASCAGAFFTHGAKILIENAAKLKPYLRYAEKIFQEKQESSVCETFLIQSAEILLEYPTYFRRYADMSLKLTKASVKRSKKTKVNAYAETAYMANAIKVIRESPEQFDKYGSEGMTLLRDVYLTPKVAEEFYMFADKILIHNPKKLRKYIEKGKIVAKNFQAEHPDKISGFFATVAEVTSNNPKDFTRISNHLVKKSRENRMRIITREDIDCEYNGIELKKKYPDTYDKYVQYAKEFSRIDLRIRNRLSLQNILPGFLSTGAKFMDDPKMFDAFARTALKSYYVLETAQKFFSYFEKESNKTWNIDDILEIERLADTQKNIFIKPADYHYKLNRANKYNQSSITESTACIILNSIIKRLGGQELLDEEKEHIKYFSEDFMTTIGDKHKELFNAKQYPTINDLLRKKKDFPNPGHLFPSTLSRFVSGKQHYQNYDARTLVSDSLEELKHYFSKVRKLSRETMEEVSDLELMFNIYFQANWLKFKVNSNRLGEYFSDREDCLSYKGKYAKEARNFLHNSTTSIISINAYSRYTHQEFFDKNIGRIFTCIGEIDNKKVWYIAGTSGEHVLSFIQGWERESYNAIMQTAIAHKDRIDGIFFDLNPRNRDRVSHDWAAYIAREIGLIEDKDYTYKLKNLSTDNFSTHRKKKLFELTNLEWKKIKILRDEGLEGKFFLESVMQEPKNKEIGLGTEPDLVYNQGYIVGAYVSVR